MSPGIQLKCRGRSTGAAKFTTWLAYFCDIIEPGTEPEVQFTLTDGELRLRCLMVKVPTTFFENDRILRSINLPVNYGFTDLVRLHLSNRYTREEIEFNNLEPDVSQMLSDLESDISEASFILKKYGFSRNEVESIIHEKVMGGKKAAMSK